MPKEVRAKLPALYAQEDRGEDAMVWVKYFNPYGRGTWYITEFDGEDTLFGYCESPLGPDCDELGYASLSELMNTEVALFGRVKVPAIERDLGFQPKPLSEIRKSS